MRTVRNLACGILAAVVMLVGRGADVRATEYFDCDFVGPNPALYWSSDVPDDCGVQESLCTTFLTDGDDICDTYCRSECGSALNPSAYDCDTPPAGGGTCYIEGICICSYDVQ